MTTEYNGKIVEETDEYYVVLEQMANMRAFRRVQYYKNNSKDNTKITEQAPSSYEIPSYSAVEIPASNYFTGGGGEFSGGGASSSYDSSSSDSSSDSSSSSSD